MIYSRGQQFNLKVNAQFKTRIKRFFAKYYVLNREIATLSDIKKRYPKSDFRSPVSWLGVLADMMDGISKEVNFKNNRKLLKPLYIRIEEIIKSVPHLEIVDMDYIAGTIATIRYVDDNRKHSLSMGRFGWSAIREKFIHDTRHSYRTFNTLDEAFKSLCKFANVSPQIRQSV